MLDNTTLKPLAPESNTYKVPLKSELVSKQYEQELVKLSQEINQLKDDLRTKYQELARLKENVINQKKLRSKINSQARKLNNLKLNLPNFLIIGTQKGGTTWLHENLKQHPQVFLPKGKKELEFFSYYQKKIDDHGLNYYLKYFNQFEDLIKLEKSRAIGEATPSYFWSTNPRRKWTNPPNKHFNEQIPSSIANLLGSEVKLILCLRDPVERAISAYFHHIKRGRISYQSQRILDVGYQHGIIDMGFYSQHLNVWLETFSLDNFKILIYERDIKQNKQQTIIDTCNFLGVDYQLFPNSTNLNQYYNRGLQYHIESDGVYLTFPDSDQREIVVNQDELKQLRQIYRADCLSLQRTLGIDLAKYWNFDLDFSNK